MWNMRSEDRLKEWRDFRNSLGALPFDEAVRNTVHLWSYAPFVNHYLDHCDPDKWPSPWELLTENRYDETAKVLGMLYTLFLSPNGRLHSYNFVVAELGLERYNLAYVDDGKYVLNFTFDEVVSKEQLEKDGLSAVKIYSETDLQLHKY